MQETCFNYHTNLKIECKSDLDSIQQAECQNQICHHSSRCGYFPQAAHNAQNTFLEECPSTLE